jgi:WS/DGAT/MGAT family acyltransferase
MLDLMFFLSENQDNPRHVGAVLVFEKPKHGGEQIVQRVIDAYRGAKPVPPFNRIPLFRLLGLPEWREVDDFDMHWHVQHLALPAPGSDAQLHALVAELHAPVLERHRPGWKVYVIDGLERDRFALYIKVHHALVDGESGMALTRRSLATSPRSKRIQPVVATRLPAPKQSKESDAARSLEREAGRLVRGMLAASLGSTHLLEESLEGLQGFSEMKDRPFTAAHTPMNDPIHNARAITHTALPLAAMKQVARSWEATLNDVALCVLDAAMLRYLRQIGKPALRPIVTVCPVSLQDEKIKKASTQVSVFWTRLGTPSASIARRMRQVIANTRIAKERLRDLPKDAAYAYSVALFLLTEAMVMLRRPSNDFMLGSNVLISNVRGPEEPLYLGGAKLEALCPVSTLIGGMGLNITFMSYAGKVVVGFTANASALPRSELLATYTQEAFAALERATRRKAASRPEDRRLGSRDGARPAEEPGVTVH